MTFDKAIDLCFTFNTADRATRGAMRSLVIPRIQREIRELEQCRAEIDACENADECRDSWAEADLYSTEMALHLAVSAANRRLALTA